MRRLLAAGLMAVVLAGLLPVAGADDDREEKRERRGKGGGDGPVLLERLLPPEPRTQPPAAKPPSPEPEDRKDERPAPEGAVQAAQRRSSPAIGSGALGALAAITVAAAVALLAIAMLLAWRARRPPTRSPPKRTFAAGRRAGLRRAPASVDEALQAVAAGNLGQVLAAREVADGVVDVAVARRRSQPCEQVAGFLAGLFESAWASDVRVAHDRCAGKAKGEACAYRIARRPPEPGGFSPAGRRAGAASTPGSAGAPRRWPPARPGGG